MQAGPGPFTNGRSSKDLPPAPSGPGHALGTAQLLGGSARPRRPLVVSGSAAARLPITTWSGNVPHAEGTLKFVTVEPPAKFVVSVKLLVPHWTVASVLTRNGV